MRETWDRKLDVVRALRASREIARRHDRATREELQRVQDERLRALVRHAKAHSPFHAERLRGIDPEAPGLLRRLPTMDKAAMMADLPRVLADPALRDVDLEAHVNGLQGDELLLGRYRVMASSGTCGVRGIYVYDRDAWVETVGGMAAAATWVGVPPRVPRPRLATIWAGGPAHMTARVAGSFRSPAYRRLRLAATLSIDDMVRELNAFRPEWLTSYPTIAALLADEQLAGRLEIAPRAVMVTSEQCTPAMRARTAAAWGSEPFDCYASTETSAIAFECVAHAGLHVLEGFVILEVDDGRVLVTNLVNKVQPMIRYELTDLVTLAEGPCACGRASRRIAAIEGRSDDIIRLPDPDGRAVPVHPNHFAEAIESIAGVRAYQVTETDEGIDVALLATGDEVAGAVRAAVGRRLEALRVGNTPLHVRRVGEIGRPDSASGKFKLVRARPSRRSEPSSREPSRSVSAS